MSSQDRSWQEGDLTASEEGAAPRKGTHAQQSPGGTWTGSGGGGVVESIKQHPPCLLPPVLLMHFSVVSTTIN